jgi:hypothetical protein
MELKLKPNIVNIWQHPSGNGQWIAAQMSNDEAVILGYGNTRIQALQKLEETLNDYVIDPFGRFIKLPNKN